MSDLYTLTQVEELTGIKKATLKKRIQRPGPSQIPAVKTYNAKGIMEWSVSLETLNTLLNRGKRTNFASIKDHWVRDMRAGHISRKPMDGGIDVNIQFLYSFFIHLDIEPSVDAVNSDNLEKCIDKLVPNAEKQTCHYSLKTNIKKALISFTKSLIRQGYKTPEDETALREIRFSRLYPPHRTVLTYDEYIDLLEFNDEWTYGRSKIDVQCTKTIVMLMAEGGLRCGDVANLDISHINFAESKMFIMHGKGKKNRIVGITPELSAQLNLWLEVWRPETDEPSGRVITSKRRKPMAQSSISGKVNRLAASAVADISPHGLRRTCATNLSKNTMPIVEISLIMGHSDIRTTNTYIMADANDAADRQANRGVAVVKTKEEKKTNRFVKQSTISPISRNSGSLIRRYR